MRVAIAGRDEAARAALLERLIPGLMARGAELWVQVDAQRGEALAARLRASGLIARQRIVHVLPARAPPGGPQRIVLADFAGAADAADLTLTLLLIDADDVLLLAPAALRHPAVLVLGRDADAALLRQLRARRAGRPVLPADLATGEGIERVLAFIAGALHVAPAPPKAPSSAARKRALWT